MSMSSSSSASSSSKFKYDVFLTLTDPESRLKSYLENRFRDAGITAFIDEAEEEGFPVEPVVVGSKVLTVLLTPEFVGSEKCLERLINYMVPVSYRLSREQVHCVVPVFCGVSREQVHQKMMALPYDFDHAEFASLPGFKLTIDSGNEISSHTAKLGHSMLHGELFQDVPHYQVGLPLRMTKLRKLLGLRYILSDDTVIVGIWGDGGIGKTTIVKAIYDRIGGNFEGKSFLSIIKDGWDEDNGEALLKKKLISDISGTELYETNVTVMHEQMEQALGGRRVLVVLDDVNSESQFKGLCRNVKWCGRGSLILITARDKAIFEDSVDISYEMKKLGRLESLELFRWHAFKKFAPTNDFPDFPERVIEYCEGLPLTLEVFGSLLYNKKKKEWKRIVNNMEGIRYGSIQDKLKIICDLLSDTEKDLFFNIACFYVGQSKHYVTELLKSSRLPVEMGMSTLIECNLVKVMNDKLYVHDLLQE